MLVKHGLRRDIIRTFLLQKDNLNVWALVMWLPTGSHPRGFAQVSGSGDLIHISGTFQCTVGARFASALRIKAVAGSSVAVLAFQELGFV